MQRRLLTLFVMLLACGSSGCSLWPRAADEPAEPKEAAPAVVVQQQRETKLKDEQELKLAKLWARVDELEEEQMRSKERLAIVEKGLTLGMMPEELRKPEQAKKRGKGAGKEPKSGAKGKGKGSAEGSGGDEAAASDEKKTADGDEDGKGEAKDGEAHGDQPGKGHEPKATPSGLSKEDAEAYQKALASAHDLYRAGRYGRSILEYSEIGKRFGEDVGGGMHIYWIAKAWANLKEYNTARQHLTEFIKDQPASPWVPRAKFELGRVEWQLGMQETALSRFRQIIQQYPYEDAAEMAKMELQNLDKKL